MRSWVLRHIWLMAVAIPVVFAQAVELVLLIRKYAIFEVAFILPHSLLNWVDRIHFFALSFLTDLFFWGGIVWLVRLICRRLNVNRVVAGYTTAWLMTIVS